VKVNDYTGKLHLSRGTVRHRSARHFNEPKPCDYVCANHKHIIDAYAKVGIPEFKQDLEVEVDNGETQEEVEEQKQEVIPEDWESLPFFTQRSIARKFDPTVNTKEEVVAVLSQQ